MLPKMAVPRTTAIRSRKRRAAAWAFALLTRLSAPLLGLAALAAPSPATAAEPSPRRVLAIHVEGQDAAKVRKDIEATLPDRITVATAKEFSAALRKAGQGGPLGAAMTKPKQRGRLVTRVKKAATLVGADAVLVAIVQWVKGQKRAHLVWIQADGDAIPVDEPVTLKGKDDARRSAIEAALASTIQDFAPPPPPPPTDETTKEEPPPDEKKEDEGEAPKRARHEAGSSIFAVEVGFELGGRWFTYSDGLTGNLRSYEVFGAPLVAASLELYPAAMTTVPVLRDLGLTVSYARAFGLQSATANGEPVNTLYQRFSAGLRVRIPLSRPTGPVFGVSGAYLWHTFHVDEPASLVGQVANVDYKGIRAGVDGRFPVGRVALLAGFDWIEPLFSKGPVYERFTGAGVHGLGARGGLAVRLASGFEMRLLAEYTRFFSDFDPVLGDAYVAGGALDQFLGLRLSGAYVE